MSVLSKTHDLLSHQSQSFMIWQSFLAKVSFVLLRKWKETLAKIVLYEQILISWHRMFLHIAQPRLDFFM